MNRTHIASLGLITLFAAGCGNETGTLTAAIYGEAYIEEGIPASIFSDGWEVKFTQFSVRIGEMSWGRSDGAPEMSEAAFHAFDLVQPSSGEGQVITSGTVPAGKYPAVAFRIAGTASEPSHRVVGTATKGTQRLELDWTFHSDVRFGQCESTAEVTGGAGRSQITIHSDHLFLDDLTREDPNVSFELMSRSDANGDGTLTAEELELVDITTETRYQVGSKRLDGKEIETLGAFVRYLLTTIGHIDGEGHCKDLAGE